MLILGGSLLFGIIVLFILLREMKKFKYQIKGTAGEKVRAILKVILLIEDVIFILLFAAVIVKTLVL